MRRLLQLEGAKCHCCSPELSCFGLVQSLLAMRTCLLWCAMHLCHAAVTRCAAVQPCWCPFAGTSQASYLSCQTARKLRLGCNCQPVSTHCSRAYVFASVRCTAHLCTRSAQPARQTELEVRRAAPAGLPLPHPGPSAQRRALAVQGQTTTESGEILYSEPLKQPVPFPFSSQINHA